MAFIRYRIGASLEAVGLGVRGFALALIVSSAVQIAYQWERMAPNLARYQSAISWTSQMVLQEGTGKTFVAKALAASHSSEQLYWNKN